VTNLGGGGGAAGIPNLTLNELLEKSIARTGQYKHNINNRPMFVVLMCRRLLV